MWRNCLKAAVIDVDNGHVHEVALLEEQAQPRYGGTFGFDDRREHRTSLAPQRCPQLSPRNKWRKRLQRTVDLEVQISFTSLS
jgi:hypothetical protein